MTDSDNNTRNAIHVEETSPIIRIKQAAKQVNGQRIEILVMGYADRIFIHVTMEGKIGHVISIPLANPLPALDSPDEDEEGVENTPSHLNPRFLLGSSNDPRGEIAQLYAVQIASLVVKQNPQEGRTLLVGVGLKGKIASDYESEEARELVQTVLALVGENKVW